MSDDEPDDFDVLVDDPTLGTLAITADCHLELRDAGADWHTVTLDELKGMVVGDGEFLGSLGVQFVSYRENIDTSSPLGQALFTIVSAVAQLERDLTRERVSAGVQEDIIRLKAKGASLRQIAETLGIGYGTVRTRLRRVS